MDRSSLQLETNRFVYSMTKRTAEHDMSVICINEYFLLFSFFISHFTDIGDFPYKSYSSPNVLGMAILLSLSLPFTQVCVLF